MFNDRIWHFFMTVLPLGHDLHFHLYRIGAMAEEMKRTSFAVPIRILSVSYDNYGYGVPLFYGDLLLYLPAFLTALGMRAVSAFKLMMVVLFLMDFVMTYIMILRSSTSKDFAFLAAVFYSFASCSLTNLCIRMAVGEFCASIFLPVVFCSFYNILYRPLKGDWLFLAAGMTGMILSHNLTSVFTVVFLSLWTLTVFQRLTRKSLVCFGLAALVTFGLTASYILPFMEASSVQEYQIPTNDGYQIQEFPKHTLEIQDFFLPYEIKKGLKIVFGLNWNTESWHPGATGIFLLAILLLLIRTRKCKKNKTLTAIFVLAIFVYFVMFIKPCVQWLGNFLSFMQFPWRLLMFCTLAFSIYAAYLLDRFLNARWKEFFLIVAIATACYTIGPRYVYQMYLDYRGMEYIESINPEYSGHYIMEYSPNNGDSLYLPKGVQLDLYADRGDVVICNHNDVECQIYRSDAKCYITVTNNMYHDTVLELPLYYYKGYAAIDRAANTNLTVSSSENKLVTVLLGNMENVDIMVWYKGTLIQQIGNCISMMTLLGVLVSQIILFLRSRTGAGSSHFIMGE